MESIYIYINTAIYLQSICFRTLTSEMALSSAPEMEPVEAEAAMERADVNYPQYQDQDLTFDIDR